MFGRILFQKRTEMRTQKVCSAQKLETQPSEHVPNESHKVSAPSTRTAAAPGVLAGSWLASACWWASLSLQWQQESTEKRQTTEELTHSFHNKRRYLGLRVTHSRGVHQHHSVDGGMGTQQSHNAALTPQQSALSQEKATLDRTKAGRRCPWKFNRLRPSRPGGLSDPINLLMTCM
jgi:hypothetical protein